MISSKERVWLLGLLERILKGRLQLYLLAMLCGAPPRGLPGTTIELSFILDAGYFVFDDAAEDIAKDIGEFLG